MRARGSIDGGGVGRTGMGIDRRPAGRYAIDLMLESLMDSYCGLVDRMHGMSTRGRGLVYIFAPWLNDSSECVETTRAINRWPLAERHVAAFSGTARRRSRGMPFAGGHTPARGVAQLWLGGAGSQQCATNSTWLPRKSDVIVTLPDGGVWSHIHPCAQRAPTRPRRRAAEPTRQPRRVREESLR